MDELKLKEWDEVKILDDLREDIKVILQQCDTKTERKLKLQEMKVRLNEIHDTYNVGSYHDMDSNRRKKFQSTLSYLIRPFQNEIPLAFKFRNVYDYNQKAWEDMYIRLVLILLKNKIQYSISDKKIDCFLKLNRHCYRSLEARLKALYIEKNQDILLDDISPFDYEERWKNDRNKECYKLLDFYERGMEKRKGMKNKGREVIREMFQKLKNELNLNDYSDMEASNKIKDITNISFLDEYGELREGGITRTMSNYRKSKTYK